MFNSIIKDFLMIEKTEPSKQLDKMMLGLELLAYNFHDSLDLGPLFKDVYRHLYKNSLPEKNKQYLDRLAKVTREVIGKQIETLIERPDSLLRRQSLDRLRQFEKFHQ